MVDFFNKFRNLKIPFITPFKVYFDLGTNITKIAVKDKGIVLKEATCLVYNTQTKDYIFAGNEAKDIIGKTPEFLKIIKPMINGIISDFDAETVLVKKFIERAVNHYLNQYLLVKPPITAIAAFPLIATEIERKAVEEVILKSGCTSVIMVDKIIATAIGCGINVFSHTPALVVDMGGGLTEICIVSSGGIVSGRTLKNGGENMDKLIANYVYLKYGVILGEATCEKLKINNFNLDNDEKITLVRGKSLENGLPKSIKIKTNEIKEAVLIYFSQIVEAVKELIEIAPPEIVDEIYNQGIVFAGKLAGISGLEKYLNEEIKIKTRVADHYSDATINGLILLDKSPENIHKLNSFISSH